MIELYIYLGLYTLAITVFTAVLPLLYFTIYQYSELALLYGCFLILSFAYLIAKAYGLTALSGIKMALGIRAVEKHY